jgi:uncharacterized protein (DUF362 family)
MTRHPVSIVSYRKPLESVLKAVELSQGLDQLPPNGKVFIKPNIGFWTRATAFPKWGVNTTSRVVEDMVIILKELGIDDITIGEGPVLMKPDDTVTPAHAFEKLGYGVLKKRYGVEYINIFERNFKKVDLGGGVVARFNHDILKSDFVINLPVLKTHGQTKVSLGIKNLKGMLDIRSRKKFHSTDPLIDLNYSIARLGYHLPPSFTLLDGIFSLEWGPSYEGRARRSNILIGSSDLLSADMVGAKVLGFDPSKIQHLINAAQQQGRSLDLSEIKVIGEKINNVAFRHEYEFKYNSDGSLPVAFEKKGIKGLSYPQYDLTHCTYCAWVNGIVLFTIARAWKGEPWDDIEVLTGKQMVPKPEMKKTILLGKCMYQAHKDNRDINKVIAVKGCPPEFESILKAFKQAGIELDPTILEHADRYPGLFMKNYADKPGFDESFFNII